MSNLKFTVKKNLTKPLLKLVTDEPVHVRITSPMTIAPSNRSESGDREDRKAAAMAPPVIVDVIDLETGEEMVMICPEVLKSELNSHFPDESYVNECFAIMKYTIAGKKYSGFRILQIDVND